MPSSTSACHPLASEKQCVYSAQYALGYGATAFTWCGMEGSPCQQLVDQNILKADVIFYYFPGISVSWFIVDPFGVTVSSSRRAHTRAREYASWLHSSVDGQWTDKWMAASGLMHTTQIVFYSSTPHRRPSHIAHPSLCHHGIHGVNVFHTAQLSMAKVMGMGSWVNTIHTTLSSVHWLLCFFFEPKCTKI